MREIAVFGAAVCRVGIALGKIGVARWRRLHRFTALTWLLSIAHALGMGTDAGSSWFLVATLPARPSGAAPAAQS